MSSNDHQHELHQLNRIEDRLDRIETKLDNQLERVTRTEESIVTIRGQVKTIITIIISVASALGAAAIKLLTGGQL